VPKAIKLLEGIGNGALVQSTAILWTNEHLCPILCPCQRAPFYCPMLILACLTGVSGLVVKSMSVGQHSAKWHPQKPKKNLGQE